MKRLLLPLLAALALPTAVSANVDSEVHKLCLPAADYLGCVKAMTTKSTDIPSMRMIDGGVELTGNSCPAGMAYTGAGMCREVRCALVARPYDVRDIALYAAGWPRCPWATSCQYMSGTKAVIDTSCPDKEPYLFTTSSCDSRPQTPPLKEIKKIVKYYKKNIPYWDKNLEKVFGIKNLATDAINYKKPPSNPNASTGSVKVNCDSPVWKNKPRCN